LQPREPYRASNVVAAKLWQPRLGLSPHRKRWGVTMLGTILVILLILILIGAVPRWPYSAGWGYGPSGIVGAVLIVVLILALTGRV